MKKVLLFLFAVLCISGCSLFDSGKKKEVSTADKVDNRTVILEINGRSYSDADFFNYAGTALRELNPKDYDNEEIKKKLLDDFIEYNLLLQEAERQNIQIDEKYLNSFLELLSSEDGSQVLKVYSGSYDTDPAVIREQLQNRLKIEELLYSKINSDIVIPEAKIKEQYKEKYEKNVPERRAHLYQIFTTDKTMAEKAMAELKRGIAFTEVASRYSSGPEKDEGGYLGIVAENDYPEIFGEAFKLQPGKRSGIIRSEYGYHIFLVDKYDRTKKPAYNSVKESIHFSLYNKEQDEKFKELINELYSSAKIKRINDIDFNNFSKFIKSRNSR